MRGFGEGGVTGNQENTQTPATAAAATLVSQWPTGDVIYNCQGHYCTRAEAGFSTGTEEACVSKLN